MDPKKNKVFSKLRDKTKPLFNVKMGKKAKKTPLRYRRSISVPDLLSDETISSLLDSTLQSSFPDSVVGPVHSFGQDEGKCETSSLTDSLNVTDTALSAPSTDPYTVPGTPFLKRALGQHGATDTSPDQVINPNNPPSARYLEQNTAPYTPSSAKTVDNFIFPNTQPAIMSPVSEKPVFTNSPATKDKLEKRMEDKERNTTWYIEDSESACSTPSEDRSFMWPPEHDLTGFEPGTPRSTDMFVIGSAEDKNEVSWFMVFKWFCFRLFHVHDKSCSPQVSNETNDYDINFAGRDTKVSNEQVITVF